MLIKNVSLIGTVVESFDGCAFRTLYDTVLLPFINRNEQFFDMTSISYEELLHVACLVQSRAFHMQKDNWVTQTVSCVTDLRSICCGTLIHSSRLS